MKYKRYIIFALEQYYPSGGFHDAHSSFDELEEAMVVMKKLEKKYASCHIFDCEEKQTIDLY